MGRVTLTRNVQVLYRTRVSHNTPKVTEENCHGSWCNLHVLCHVHVEGNAVCMQGYLLIGGCGFEC